jgi:hypothetical protein
LARWFSKEFLSGVFSNRNQFYRGSPGTMLHFRSRVSKMTSANFLTRLRSTVYKILPPAREDDPNEPITVATLQPLMEFQAEVMRTRLETEGIPCMITRERACYVGPILLRVRRADVDEARLILKEMEDS